MNRHIEKAAAEKQKNCHLQGNPDIVQKLARDSIEYVNKVQIRLLERENLSAGIYKARYSKVSLLLDLLYEVTVELTVSEYDRETLAPHPKVRSCGSLLWP